ncbi:zinc finger protein 467-like [Pararge aegeria]|uniref:Jg3626 protein n=1 Tax=Pararge aegeria aegeria TaxID=348720 RepID=A0A8S4RDJ8_9NEOP|nr:zinc finger protein 467-like [Pararge aegeria]XP_039765655.1 zinc finger protein 467-like [Pararge aegeria]CAH2233764.1 jg3626 [Pararge aegeria aegeria]
MSKKDPNDRNERKLDSGDYENLISQHSIFESSKPRHHELPSFPGFSNAETQTKQSDLKTQGLQSSLGPWHYNPWWMLASTSRSVPSQDDYSDSDQAKVKQEPSRAGTPDRDPLQNDLEQLQSTSTAPVGLDSFCDDCSDPFCDSSVGMCRKLFHCPHCRKSYPTILEFNTHLTGVHPAQKPFRCQICLEPFYKKSHLRRHLDSHHTRKDVNKCSVCSKYIKDKSNLRKHMQVHTGRVPQKQFKCDLCNNKRYMSLDRLNNHKVVCTGEKVLKYCDMCTKVFDNSRSLNSHKKVHARELKCEICGEQLRSLEQFNNHKMICLGGSQEAGSSGAANTAGAQLSRCCTQPGLCEHDKPAYLNIPSYAAGRVLDATMSSLKSEMN